MLQNVTKLVTLHHSVQSKSKDMNNKNEQQSISLLFVHIGTHGFKDLTVQVNGTSVSDWAKVQ